MRRIVVVRFGDDMGTLTKKKKSFTVRHKRETWKAIGHVISGEQVQSG